MTSRGRFFHPSATAELITFNFLSQSIFLSTSRLPPLPIIITYSTERERERQRVSCEGVARRPNRSPALYFCTADISPRNTTLQYITYAPADVTADFPTSISSVKTADLELMCNKLNTKIITTYRTDVYNFYRR